MIVLKNINGRATAKGGFRGRDVIIKPKHSYIIDSTDKKEDEEEAKYILSTFAFVIDITKRIEEEQGVKT